MIEPVRTMYGTVIGDHSNKRTKVVEQTWWRCTLCEKYFKRHEEADRHSRREHSESK